MFRTALPLFFALCALHSERKESARYLLTCESFQAVFVWALHSFPRLYIALVPTGLKYIVGSQNSLCVIHWLISLTCASSHEPPVPPNAELSIEVKLLEATDAPDLELLPPVERIALASLKREKGNAHYQRGDYAFAVNSYSIALQITESNSKGEMQARDSGLNEGVPCHSVLGMEGVWEVGEHNIWGVDAYLIVCLEGLFYPLKLKETLF